MLTYAEWIPTLDIPEQQIDLAHPPKSQSTTPPLTNITLLHNDAIRPAAIGPDSAIQSRLLQHLNKLLKHDPRFSANVPYELQFCHQRLKRQAQTNTQNTETSVDVYVYECVEFLLEVLEVLQPELDWKVRQHWAGNSKLGITPDVVVVDSLDNVKLLIEDKTQKVLEKHINTLKSMQVRFDWTQDSLQLFTKGSACLMLIKLVYVMLEQHLAYAFLVDGTRYCILQAAQNAQGDNVILISSFLSFADPHFPFLSIILSSLLVANSTTQEVPSSLAVPAAIIQSSLNWPRATTSSLNQNKGSAKLDAIIASNHVETEDCSSSEATDALITEGRMRNRSNDPGTVLACRDMNIFFAPTDGVRPPDLYTVYPHDAYKSSFFKATQLEIGYLLNTSSFASAFMADLQGKKVVAKIAPVGYQGGDMLIAEAKIYSKMKRLFDVAIPRCHGFFQGDGLLVLLTDYAGQALKDWSELSSTSARQLYQHLLTIHAEGIHHGDFEERNVVIDPVTQQIKIIDFSHSEFHHCGEHCHELELAKRELGC